MELSIISSQNKTTWHSFNRFNAVVVKSEFIDSPMSFPIVDQPLILVKQYAVMTVMHTVIKKLIFQRYNNYLHSPYFEKYKNIINTASNIADLMFVEKQKYNYQKYIAMFKEGLFPLLRQISPPEDKSLYNGYLKKIQYLSFLANINPEKISNNYE
jgi:hypothetical protein